MNSSALDRKACAEYLNGPISSVVTPFNRDGSIDYEGLRNFIDRSIGEGSKTVLLTAGDSHHICMSDKEIAEVTKVAAHHTAGRSLVVAADNDYATPQAIEFAKYAKSAGAGVLMCRPPDWADSTTPETLAEHYVEVSKHIPVMIVTWGLGLRGHDFGLDVIRLAIEQSESIVAVKDDVVGEFAQRLSVLCRGTGVVAFAGGLKTNHLNMVPFGGGHCYMSTFQMGAAHITEQYWAAVQEGNLKLAEEIIQKYETPYFAYLSKMKGGWNAGIHGALELFGVAKRWRRKPYYSLTDREMEGLHQAMCDLGIL